MKKILITGGSGFIGSNIARQAWVDGLDVTVLDNLSSGYAKNLEGFDLRFVEGDIRDREKLTDCMKGCDTVFHLAASVGNARAIADPVEDSDINVMGTLYVLEAARAMGVKKVVFSSSAGIYGELKTLPIKEDHPVEPDSPYGASKLCAEKQCLAYAKLFDLDCVCLRYFNVFGVHQRFDAYGNVIPIFVHRLLREEGITIFGDGEQTRDFVNVGDVVQANLKAAAAEGVSGVFNVGSATRVTINHLVDLLLDIGGWRGSAKVEYGPSRPGDVLHSLADIDAARKAIGFEPTVDFRQGLVEYVAWARKDQG